MQRLRCCSILILILGRTVPVAAEPDGQLPPETSGFVGRYCLDCHGGESAEADFRLDTLPQDLPGSGGLAGWVKVYDRLQAGEMPPADAAQPEVAERTGFLDTLREALTSANVADQQRFGRTQFRRLNRVEYEQTLRDLLALPHLEVSAMLPPDGSAHGFDNVGSALDLSYVQMSRYLDGASAALEAAIILTPRPAQVAVRLEARTNGRFAQVLNKQKEAVPIGTAVGLLRQPNTAQAPWWWSKFEPPADGDYRLRMKSFGFVWDRGQVLPADRLHALTFLSVQGTTKRPLGTFDVGRSESEASIHDFTAYLRRGDQVQIWFETLDDRNKGSRELSSYTAPGVALEWLEIEGPILQTWPPASYRRLFGNLNTAEWTPETGLQEPPLPMVVNGVGKWARLERANRNKSTLHHVVSADPTEDARRLLLSFASRAFRRPVTESEIVDILQLVQVKLDGNECFQEAMRIGFQAILCSPEFLFLQEQPGRLDQYALASRLSYFLWSSLPDDTLLSLAEQQTLDRAEVLREQVERMLDDPKSQRFVENFCGQWLDLRRITITQPDEQLYPEFDQLLLSSMVEETHAFFKEMLREDLGVGSLVDSDFAMINSRLAELYGVPGVDGVAIRRVRLPPESVRGGILTQASVLKVTANGTTTSPVTRGAWVLDRIYGAPAPLPPPNVPAVEPDLRGTTTIREQLDQHRNIASCAGCHSRIDPPGFALESFDVIGGWRDRYRSLENGDTVHRTFQGDRPVQYKLGLPVDSTGTAPGGETFADIKDFRRILLTRQEELRGIWRDDCWSTRPGPGCSLRIGRLWTTFWTALVRRATG